MRKWNVIILLERNQHNSKSLSINKSVSRAIFYEQTALIDKAKYNVVNVSNEYNTNILA
jgi:hypothetical protein